MRVREPVVPRAHIVPGGRWLVVPWVLVRRPLDVLEPACESRAQEDPPDACDAAGERLCIVAAMPLDAWPKNPAVFWEEAFWALQHSTQQLATPGGAYLRSVEKKGAGDPAGGVTAGETSHTQLRQMLIVNGLDDQSTSRPARAAQPDTSLQEVKKKRTLAIFSRRKLVQDGYRQDLIVWSALTESSRPRLRA